MASGDEADTGSVRREEHEQRSRSGSRSRSRSRHSRGRSASRSKSRGRSGSRAGSKSGIQSGRVVRWHARGYGFIKPDSGGEDIFCHVSAIKDGNALEEGGTVEYELVYDDRRQKYRTQNVTGGIREERPAPRRRDYEERRGGGYRRRSRSRSRGYGGRDRYYEDRDRKRDRYDYDDRERGRARRY